LPEAVILAWLLAATERAVTVKVAYIIPAGTVTEAGTVATAVLLLERLTTTPPVGAVALR
jgi:hypothetical protein